MRQDSLEKIISDQRNLIHALRHEILINEALLAVERDKTRELSHRVDVLVSIINNLIENYGNN